MPTNPDTTLYQTSLSPLSYHKSDMTTLHSSRKQNPSHVNPSPPAATPHRSPNQEPDAPHAYENVKQSYACDPSAQYPTTLLCPRTDPLTTVARTTHPEKAH